MLFWGEIQLTYGHSKCTFSLFLSLWSPLWAVAPATVVASFGRTSLQQDNAEFLTAVICVSRVMVSH